MLDSQERNHTVDLETLSPETFEIVSKTLAANLQAIFLAAKTEADRLMKPYGYETQVQLDLLSLKPTQPQG